MERAHEEGKMETANEKKWRLKADQLVRDMEVMDKAFKVRIQELEEDIHALIGYSPRHCIDCPIDIDGVCLCGFNNLKAKYEPPKH